MWHLGPMRSGEYLARAIFCGSHTRHSISMLAGRDREALATVSGKHL